MRESIHEKSRVVKTTEDLMSIEYRGGTRRTSCRIEHVEWIASRIGMSLSLLVVVWWIAEEA
jgi:hypothetical protein